MSQRILAVLHQADSVTGRVGEFLEARGYTVEQCCPVVGAALPERLDDYAGTVVFGGPQSANDDHLPGVRTELDWIELVALPAARPLLGICLGAQQIARVLGARIARHDEGLVEIGFTRITPTEAGRDFLPAPTPFYQWHAETFEIPRSAVHLAGSEAFPNQAYRYDGCVYGLEFHPEMTLEMIECWCTSQDGAPKLLQPGAHSHAEQIADFHRHARDCDRWLADFLDNRFLPDPGRA